MRCRRGYPVVSTLMRIVEFSVRILVRWPIMLNVFRGLFRLSRPWNYLLLFVSWLDRPNGPRRGFTIILRHTTVGRTPLSEWYVRRRDLYLTTHNTHTRQISMPPEGFEPAIPASERSQTHALDRTATGIGSTALRISFAYLVAFQSAKSCV